MVIDHMIALTPPMMSSFDGTSPVEGQMPLRTYKGEVPTANCEHGYRYTARKKWQLNLYLNR